MDIRDYFEKLQSNSGTKRKMVVCSLESDEGNFILGSHHKRLKTGACMHMQAARDSKGETRKGLVNTEQPIICDKNVNLGSIGHEAVDNRLSRPAHKI